MPVDPAAGAGSGARPVVLFLPARNEAPTVGAVLGRAPSHVEVGGRRHPVRLVVVDDGSTDETAARAADAGAEVLSTPGLGLGAAVRIGLQHAVRLDAAAVAFCDADGEYDPAQLPDLVAPILRGEADYVVGSRFAGGPRRMKLHRNVGNRILTALTAASTRHLRSGPLTDGQSGYRALSSGAAASAHLVHDYNYAQVLTIDLLRSGHRYAEVPIRYAHRTVGRSYIRLPTYLRRVLPAMWRARRGRRAATTGRGMAVVTARHTSETQGASALVRR